MEIKSFQKVYPTTTLTFPNVSLKTPLGIVIGPNGCGKSTWLKAVAGLIQTQPTVRLSHTAFLDHHTHVPQGVTLAFFLERLATMLNLSMASLENHLKAFDLWSCLTKKTQSLSKGMRQKALLSVLLASQKTLLLDEPEDGLDVASLDYFLEAVSKRQARTIIATHQKKPYLALKASWIEL